MKGKQVVNNARRDFFKSYTHIFRCGLEASTVVVYCYLSSCSESFNPPVRYMAEVLKLSRNTVIKALRVLTEKNIIALVQKARKGQTARYEFVEPELWKL